MAEQREPVVYLNGETMPHSQAVAAMKGTPLDFSGGVYDAERTFNGRIFKLREHLERLYRGLAYTGVDPGLSLEEMESVTLRVLEDNLALLKPGDDFTVRQVVGFAAPAPSDGKGHVNIVVFCQPINFAEFAMSYVNGVRIVTPASYGVQSRAGQDEAKRGSQTTFPLMSDREGCITECPGANFMFCRDGRIMLPERRNVLPGVSMHTVLELAGAMAVPVEEGDYTPHDLYLADEAFVTSTRYCMLPVATVNGLSLPEALPGPVTRRLLDAWRELVGLDFVRQALGHLPPDGPGPVAPAS